MTPRQALNLARAVELDDPWPDDVCPGCQQDITGWPAYEAHRMPTTERRQRHSMGRRRYVHDPTPWPFQHQAAGPCTLCPWNRDYLNARAHRRRYIAQHQQVAS